MFDHFGQRLKRDLKKIVDQRIEASEVSSKSSMRVRTVLFNFLLVPLTRSFSRPGWKSMSFLIKDNAMLFGMAAHFWLPW